MILRQRIRVTWLIDLEGKEFHTETQREYKYMASIGERHDDAEADARGHEIMARKEAKIADPSPVKLEYFRVRENGETVLCATPMYILGTFGKRLCRA